MELAIIKTGGKQYIVSPGKKIKIEKLNIEKGNDVIFDEVLLFQEGDNIKIGDPLVSDVKIKGKVITQEKSDKIIVFKYKPKKRYRVKKGHRQFYTEVEITEIAK